MNQKLRQALAALTLAAFTSVSPVLAQSASDAVFTDTIDGKEYKIAPGEKPGTWKVSYGEDSLVWEALPWMDTELANQGPKFFQRWSKPGLPYPWEISAAERVALAKTAPGDMLDRYHAGTVFFSFAKSMLDVAALPLTDARGNVREKVLQEWAQSYVPEGNNWENLPKSEQGKVSRKYLWVYRSPSEVEGLGGRTVSFTDKDRRPDEWLYAPSVRKVRRLSAGVSQDYLPGTIFHLDQLSHVQQLPDMDYKLVGVELWKGDPTAIGFRPEDLKFGFIWPDGSPQKAIDRVGDLALVVEITPKPGVSWWFAKMYRRFGLYSGYWIGDDAYNEKGERIQTAYLRSILPPEDQRNSIPPYYVHWGQLFCHEPLTGLRTDSYQVEPVVWDADIPAWLFNQDTLLKEPSSLVFW